MTRFRFLHSADLHIDSPLIGLATKSEELASRIDDASRRAFDNLISTAIDEECNFIVISLETCLTDNGETTGQGCSSQIACAALSKLGSGFT
jgi:hypothetical protein